MTTPTVTLLLPTVGRPELSRMLQSIREQDLSPGDEVLLISDANHEAVATAWSAAELPGRRIVLPDGPHRDWGHTPRNRTMVLARSDYLLHIDDDDILLPGALTRIRAAIRQHPADFHIFPFLNGKTGQLVGRSRELTFGRIGTPNLAHPRSATPGVWESRVGGDAAFISSTTTRNPDRTIYWNQDVHYYAHLGGWTLSECYAVAFRTLRATDPAHRLIPAKSIWTDLADLKGGAGREDCQVGWHTLAAKLCAGLDVLDVGAGLGFSRDRLSKTARRVRLQDPGPGLPVDLACPIVAIPDKDADIATAFDVLEHVEDDRGFIEDLLRIARSGVFLTTPNWFVSRAANHRHCREYTPNQFLALVDGLPVAGLWGGDSRGFEAQQLNRVEFSRHIYPHQAVFLHRSG